MLRNDLLQKRAQSQSFLQRQQMDCARCLRWGLSFLAAGESGRKARWLRLGSLGSKSTIERVEWQLQHMSFCHLATAVFRWLGSSISQPSSCQRERERLEAGSWSTALPLSWAAFSTLNRTQSWTTGSSVGSQHRCGKRGKLMQIDANCMYVEYHIWYTDIMIHIYIHIHYTYICTYQ